MWGSPGRRQHHFCWPAAATAVGGQGRRGGHGSSAPGLMMVPIKAQLSLYFLSHVSQPPVSGTRDNWPEKDAVTPWPARYCGSGRAARTHTDSQMGSSGQLERAKQPTQKISCDLMPSCCLYDQNTFISESNALHNGWTELIWEMTEFISYLMKFASLFLFISVKLLWNTVEIL